MLYLDIYGLRVKVNSSNVEILERIRKDFLYFSGQQDQPDIRIAVYKQAVPHGMIPETMASMYQPDSVSYDCGNVRYVDYHGKALVVYDYTGEEGKIYSEDIDLLHELGYLLVLSRAGEMLDIRGIHRLHALGLTYMNRAVLCIMPQGAGKTALGMDMLNMDGIKLLSDDTPLFTAGGRILPFPLRIGIKEDDSGRYDIDRKYCYRISRRNHCAKTLVTVDYFKERISGEVAPSLILIGERISSGKASIEPVSGVRSAISFFKNGVVGLGLPQMVEYFLRGGKRDFLRKSGILFSRLRAASKILERSDTFLFTVGNDRGKNSGVLKDFLSSRGYT